MPDSGRTDRRKVPDLIGVEHELLEGPGAAKDVVGNGGQASMALVDVVYAAVASFPEGHTLHHDHYALNNKSPLV